MVDSRLPRFSQGMQAVLLGLAFLFDARFIVPALAVVLGAAVLGGPKLNLWAHLYRALPIPAGEPEPAAPPRFAQMIGTVFLVVGSAGLYLLEAETTTWWVLGWGPALAVAVLSAVAATTSFCLGCEIYLLLHRARQA